MYNFIWENYKNITRREPLFKENNTQKEIENVEYRAEAKLSRFVDKWILIE